MNIPQIPAALTDRARWLKIAVVVWLLLISALAVVNRVGLSRRAEQSQTRAQDIQVQALARRMGELEQQVGASQRQPKAVSQADFDSVRQTLDERLSRIEQARSADDKASEMQTLRARIGAIEERVDKVAAQAVAPRPAVEAPKPKVPAPPFKVIGLELRDGERFLSVQAPGAASGGATEGDLRLLREGDALGAWQLQSVEAKAVVFRADGQAVRIAVP